MKIVSGLFFLSLMAVASSCQSTSPNETFFAFADAAGSDDVARFKGFLTDDFYGGIDRSRTDQVDNILRLHMMAIPKLPVITNKKQTGDSVVFVAKGTSRVGDTTGTTTLVKRSGSWKVLSAKWTPDKPSQYFKPIESGPTRGSGPTVDSCRQAARAVVPPYNSMDQRKAGAAFLIAPENNCSQMVDGVIRGFEQRGEPLSRDEQNLVELLKSGRR